MNPFLLMISTTPIASGAMSVLMVLETVSSDLTFFSGLSTHISLYGHIYLSLFGCFWGFSNWTNPKLLSMYHLSLLQTKILSLSAYPPIHSFIQFGSGILHWLLSLTHCIWSIACLLIPNPSCFLVPPDLFCFVSTSIFIWQETPGVSWSRVRLSTPIFLGFLCGSADKESACNAGDLGSIPGLGRSSGEGKCYPLQYSGLENSMDCIVHGVTKSQTQLNNFHFTLTTLHK